MIGQSPSFSVSDFVAVFNQTIEFSYPEVEIVGELSNFRVSKNAWVYFDLKDDSASLKFFGSVRALPGPLEDGMILKVVAKPYLHPVFNFSMQIYSVVVSGEGDINKAYLLLRDKLQKEGLFDLSRKRSLSYPPEKIYLITSKESAAYGDFMKIIRRRWPMLNIELKDVNVQGKEAAQHIVQALGEANQAVDAEVAVIIRGGGSRDDLSIFDHESVVRAVASSRIPTLVAVGHERDEALAELVADVRASTPSNAAELLVPDANTEQTSLKQIAIQADNYLKNHSRIIKNDILSSKNTIVDRLNFLYQSAKDGYSHYSVLVRVLDPERPLKSGFSLAKTYDGKLIKSAGAASSEGAFVVQFKDGKIEVITKGGNDGKG